MARRLGDVGVFTAGAVPVLMAEPGSVVAVTGSGIDPGGDI